MTTLGVDVPCYRCHGRGTRHSYHLVMKADWRLSGRERPVQGPCSHVCPSCQGSAVSRPLTAPELPKGDGRGLFDR